MTTPTISHITDAILDYLKTRDLLHLLPEIVSGLKARISDDSQVTVESAIALSAREQTSLTEILKSKYGVKSAVNFTVNPKLLGGLRIVIGDQVLDTSVLARLNDVYGG